MSKYRFGIGEWYGRSFINLTPNERRALANLTPEQMEQQPCIPRQYENPQTKCSKPGGVCSLRLYQMSNQIVSTVDGPNGDLRTLCPYRFHEEGKVVRWVGEIILGNSNPLIVSQIGFLRGRGNRDVGRIDMILVDPNLDPFSWCAVETQAVYFSGKKMQHDFHAIANHIDDSLPFPIISRRPDYRSSGHKRLMPQLQTKVPTLRRWGKKLAVVVDRNFWGALENIPQVGDITSCDIVWFIVKYEYEGRGTEAALEPDFYRFTTLERTVEGLTAGVTIPLTEFENKIRQKIQLFLF